MVQIKAGKHLFRTDHVILFLEDAFFLASEMILHDLHFFLWNQYIKSNKHSFIKRYKGLSLKVVLGAEVEKTWPHLLKHEPDKYRDKVSYLYRLFLPMLSISFKQDYYSMPLWKLLKDIDKQGAKVWLLTQLPADIALRELRSCAPEFVDTLVHLESGQYSPLPDPDLINHVAGMKDASNALFIANSIHALRAGEKSHAATISVGMSSLPGIGYVDRLDDLKLM